MANIKYLRANGGTVTAYMDDGSTVLMYPGTHGVYLPRYVAPPEAPEPEPPVTPPPTNTGWVHPLPAGSVTSGYGNRGGMLHAGADISSVGGYGMGGVIRATAAMRITVAREAFTGGLADAGTYVKGHTIHGTPYTFSHFHGHPGTLAVRVGDIVNPGDPLMREGNSGNSYGSHLHLEIWPGHLGPASAAGSDGPWYWGDGTPPDPLPILRANGVRI